MRKELPKQYDPKQVEGQIYELWMENDCFKATPDPDKKPYCIVMPPPNVTGQLHMGHALACKSLAGADGDARAQAQPQALETDRPDAELCRVRT